MNSPSSSYAERKLLSVNGFPPIKGIAFMMRYSGHTKYVCQLEWYRGTSAPPLELEAELFDEKITVKLFIIKLFT